MYKIFKIITFLFLIIFSAYSEANSEEKVKVGILVPMTGDNKDIGKLIIKATKMALKEINNDNVEVYPKDSGSDPNKSLASSYKFKEMGIKVVIGPVFFKSSIYLDEIKDITFLSLTNKTINLPKNVISSGINATSQVNAIKEFINQNGIEKTIFLTPKLDYREEVKKAIKQSKIKISKHHIYETEPTKLTKQIEDITNYKTRKQNLADEIKRVEDSDLIDKEEQLEQLKKIYTIGDVSFDSVIISDFDESLKSVITSLLYTDVLPKNKFIITFNQWFNKSLLNEEILQPIYYPSINKENLEKFEKEFLKQFNEKPNHLALLSYDLLGLIYYLSLENNILEIDKIFKKKNSFRGKIGVFDVENNKINHRLNFYQIADSQIKKIF